LSDLNIYNGSVHFIHTFDNQSNPVTPIISLSNNRQ